MGKVSTLTHFQLKPGCENYSFLDQAVEDFENGHDPVLTNSTDTPELDVSFDLANAMPSSSFLYLVSTVSDTFGTAASS